MTKKNKLNKENLIPKDQEDLIQSEPVYHIYDFLIRCRINRAQHDILMKKFESNGLKTIQQWLDLTHLKLIK